MESSTEQIRSLFEDPAVYSKSYRAFTAASDKFAVKEKWMNEAFPSLVLNKLTANFPHLDDKPFKMLGVGSGTGEYDLELAWSLQSQFGRVHNTVVEPVPDHMASYRKFHEKSAKRIAGKIEFDFKEQRIEEYLEDEGARGTKFHFISAVHSIYHVDGYEAVVSKLYDRLENGGLLFIIIMSDASGIATVFKTFPELQNRMYASLTSLDLCKILDAHSISYECSCLEVRVNITQCLDGSQPATASEESDLILDFACETMNVRKSVSSTVYGQLMDLLKSDRCSDRGRHGEVLLNDFADVLVVEKMN